MCGFGVEGMGQYATKSICECFCVSPFFHFLFGGGRNSKHVPFSPWRLSPRGDCIHPQAQRGDREAQAGECRAQMRRRIFGSCSLRELRQFENFALLEDCATCCVRKMWNKDLVSATHGMLRSLPWFSRLSLPSSSLKMSNQPTIRYFPHQPGSSHVLCIESRERH